MDARMADMLHEQGKMPTWAWVRVNGRTKEQNWEYQQRELREKFNESRRKKQQDEALKKHVKEVVEAELEDCLKNVLKDISKTFK